MDDCDDNVLRVGNRLIMGMEISEISLIIWLIPNTAALALSFGDMTCWQGRSTP